MTLLNGHLPAFLSEVERIAKNRGILWQSALDTEQPLVPFSHLLQPTQKEHTETRICYRGGSIPEHYQTG